MWISLLDSPTEATDASRSPTMAAPADERYTIGPIAEADIAPILAFEVEMARELGFPPDDPRGTYDEAWFTECCRGTFACDNGHKRPCLTLVARELGGSARVAGGIMCYLDRARFGTPPAGSTAPAPKRRKRAQSGGTEDFLEVFWLYVARAHRKARLGAALLEEALADARGRWPHLRRARLHCLRSNTAGLGFWAAMQFERLRLVSDYPVDGMAAWRMERPLGAPPGGEGAGGGEVGSGVGSVGAHAALPPVLVLCGPCGVGKSTIGHLLSHRLGARPYVDADEYHSAQSVAKMARGEALSDADRAPWLAALHARLKESLPTGGLILSCSALRAAYRRTLRAELGAAVGFVMLRARRETLTQRVTQRAGHFARAELVPSQLEALEPLDTDAEAPCLNVDVDDEGTRSPAAIVHAILQSDAWRNTSRAGAPERAAPTQ